MRVPPFLTVLVAGAALTLIGPAAFADTVYNNLDNSIDTALESMGLTYDTVASTGTTGSTTLRIQINGHPGDHPGCNIQGGAHYISLDPVVGDPGVASVTLSNDGRFDACTDTVVATVQATGVGSTNVTFVIDAARTSNDPSLTFNLDQAAFTVNVTAGTAVTPTGCDVDPAAPAWANAMLQKAGIKAKAANNYISQIAHEMGTGATFGGYAKNAHPQYENAVHDELVSITGNSGIPSAQDAARPGWECGLIS